MHILRNLTSVGWLVKKSSLFVLRNIRTVPTLKIQFLTIYVSDDIFFECLTIYIWSDMYLECIFCVAYVYLCE